MAALHAALRSLSPTAFSIVPLEQSETTTYLENAFRDARTVIDSVPLPSPSETTPTTRPRSNTTTSNASNISEISVSSARSDPCDPNNEPLQKEWGKPVKINAKDNQLGISVYKLSGKDGKGNWFARRSVHDGLGFQRWKLAMQREFPESLQVQGGPGEGNIRGIGGERRVERKVVDGVGNVEVYHLSAQFPGPTTPRDFVTLLLTSSSALVDSSDPDYPESKHSRFCQSPRHFMVISRPCDHPETPSRDGFVRGQYESVEFIREIPRKKPRKSLSASDLRHLTNGASMDREATLRNANLSAKDAAESQTTGDKTASATEERIVKEARSRGKTISFAGSRGLGAKGERLDTQEGRDDDEINPVEWIMVTRSDPGGGIPRFMVDRGTPGSIVADAGKFLDWACKTEHSEEDIQKFGLDGKPTAQATKHEELEAYQTNGHLAGLEEENESEGVRKLDPAPTDSKPAEPTLTLPNIAPRPKSVSDPPLHTESSGLLLSVANAAYAGIETYAPQAILNHLPGHQQSMSTSMTSTQESPIPDGTQTPTRSLGSSSMSSVGSFASAEDHFENNESEDLSTKSILAKTDPLSKEALAQPLPSKNLTPQEKELAKLQARKRELDAKLAKTIAKETSSSSSSSNDSKGIAAKISTSTTSSNTSNSNKNSNESDRATSPPGSGPTSAPTSAPTNITTSTSGPSLERIRKAQTKHANETTKAETAYTSALAKLESRRQKDAAKQAHNQKRQLEKEDAQRRRAIEKDEKVKLTKERDEIKEKLGKEKEELGKEVERLKSERDGLRRMLGVAQGENTRLVAAVGRMGEVGEGLLRDVRAQAAALDGSVSAPSTTSINVNAGGGLTPAMANIGGGAGGTRNRSSSSLLRKEKSSENSK